MRTRRKARRLNSSQFSLPDPTEIQPNYTLRELRLKRTWSCAGSRMPASFSSAWRGARVQPGSRTSKPIVKPCLLYFDSYVTNVALFREEIVLCGYYRRLQCQIADRVTTRKRS